MIGGMTVTVSRDHAYTLSTSTFVQPRPRTAVSRAIPSPRTSLTSSQVSQKRRRVEIDVGKREIDVGFDCGNEGLNFGLILNDDKDFFVHFVHTQQKCLAELGQRVAVNVTVAAKGRIMFSATRSRRAWWVGNIIPGGTRSLI